MFLGRVLPYYKAAFGSKLFLYCKHILWELKNREANEYFQRNEAWSRHSQEPVGDMVFHHCEHRLLSHKIIPNK